jgi:hypothetical protein
MTPTLVMLGVTRHPCTPGTPLWIAGQARNDKAT